MARTVGIGIQDFAKMITNECFYVDKTDFIREWWESKDDVTLITRPRRFGKTLNMSMLEQFFSVDYAGRGELFQGFSVWGDEKYRELQGTYPVISLSFARVKEVNYPETREKICEIIRNLYIKYAFLKESPVLTDADKAYYNRILEPEIRNSDATSALYQLSDYLHRFYGKKVIILLDEYDTPMQEAFVGGYWEELVSFTRSLFNSTFKTNPWLERAVMTGITRISKESIFSDLNNLKVVTTTSDKYAISFGFTEEEVFAALEECGLSEKKEQVKAWYDGFIFGEHRDIYNPWSILNFLDTGKLGTYWANTSSNSLAGKLIQEGSRSVKEKFEILIRGGNIQSLIDEQIVYSQLKTGGRFGNESAIWSLLLASGYLKVLSYEDYFEIQEDAEPKYELTLTNLEVKVMFRNMIRDWFRGAEPDYNDFIRAMLQDDLDAMNEYMNRVALQTFSFFRASNEPRSGLLELGDCPRINSIAVDFDTGDGPSGAEPERFYHGFVLGLLVDLQDRYVITSNRESGFGRYDVVLEPRGLEENAIIIEFKVHNRRRESSLEDTVEAALQQIEEKQYVVRLLERGVPAERIRRYGFAFEGKRVLIG